MILQIGIAHPRSWGVGAVFGLGHYIAAASGLARLVGNVAGGSVIAQVCAPHPSSASHLGPATTLCRPPRPTPQVFGGAGAACWLGSGNIAWLGMPRAIGAVAIANVRHPVPPQKEITQWELFQCYGEF